MGLLFGDFTTQVKSFSQFSLDLEHQPWQGFAFPLWQGNLMIHLSWLAISHCSTIKELGLTMLCHLGDKYLQLSSCFIGKLIWCDNKRNSVAVRVCQMECTQCFVPLASCFPAVSTLLLPTHKKHFLWQRIPSDGCEKGWWLRHPQVRNLLPKPLLLKLE